MAKISPFRGVLYNKEKIKHFETVISPPYDVISSSMRDELYKADQYNIVRIILGKELTTDNKSYNKYTRAANFIDQWLEIGALKKDKSPAIYVCEQKYLHKGKPKSRIGFISLMRIEDPKTSLVLPHEYTFSKPKEDRLNLIRAVKANTEPIFCIFEDDANVVTNTLRAYCKKHAPIITVQFEGIENRVWTLAQSAIIKKIEHRLDKKQVFIADGHHRYEVSLAFRDEMRRKLGPKRAKEFENIMVYFSSLTDDNLTIFSTYRVVKSLGNIKWREAESKLKRYFYIENVNTKDEMFNALETAGSDYAFGVFFKDGRFRVLKLKDESMLNEVIKERKSREWRRLNVTVLHFLVFAHIFHIEKFSSNDENITYTRDEDYAIQQVAKGECEIAFFQLPTKMSEVRDIAKKGDRMPHKSTYFYPKPLSGLVMNRF
ncbi:MAG: DUF1015 domain-containing protein [Candidatus Omnitrophica bacterium]|nr:DUF1015 domain-containing protein [Candidatus Omnitrophota bacterium]MBU4487457.1 DUF1015 domain-containing protein [Candidatus Omnitrophota bacterium]MCG2705103.1 DUF1015 domain-containing protein [Candidatus Omnitrophota bacterium]